LRPQDCPSTGTHRDTGALPVALRNESLAIPRRQVHAVSFRPTRADIFLDGRRALHDLATRPVDGLGRIVLPNSARETRRQAREVLFGSASVDVCRRVAISRTPIGRAVASVTRRNCDRHWSRNILRRTFHSAAEAATAAGTRLVRSRPATRLRL